MEINSYHIPPSSGDFEPIKSSIPSYGLPITTANAGQVDIGSYEAANLFEYISDQFPSLNFSSFDSGTLQKIADVFCCVVQSALYSIENDPQSISVNKQIPEYQYTIKCYENFPPLEFINICVANFKNFSIGLKNQIANDAGNLDLPVNQQLRNIAAFSTCIYPLVGCPGAPLVQLSQPFIGILVDAMQKTQPEQQEILDDFYNIETIIYNLSNNTGPITAEEYQNFLNAVLQAIGDLANLT